MAGRQAGPECGSAVPRHANHVLCIRPDVAEMPKEPALCTGHRQRSVRSLSKPLLSTFCVPAVF